MPKKMQAKNDALVFLNHSFFGLCLCEYWLKKTVLTQNNHFKMSHQIYSKGMKSRSMEKRIRDNNNNNNNNNTNNNNIELSARRYK